MKSRLSLIAFMVSFGIINAGIVLVPEYVPFERTIQAGINMAQPGDTVSVWIDPLRHPVPPDTYYENIDFRGKGIFVANRSFLPGTPGYDPNYDSSWHHVVINGNQNPYSTVTMNIPHNSLGPGVIKGFTITGGSSSYGGGIRAISRTEIIKNLIKENYAQVLGGGVHITTYTTVFPPKVAENRLELNTSDDRGGGIFIESWRFEIIILENNEIISNWARNSGGGIYYRVDEEKYSGGPGEQIEGLIIDNRIDSNQLGPSGLGGGVYFRCETEASPAENIKFRKNKISNNAHFGFYLSRQGISVAPGPPNLGTFEDPGFNEFRDNASGDLYNGGNLTVTDSVNAIGNFWVVFIHHILEVGYIMNLVA